MLLETSGEKPEMLWNSLQRPPPPTKTTWPQMVVAPKLRNAGSQARYLFLCDLIKSTYLK